MILPVILSGGSGSRLWPLSTKALPKQFLPIVSDRSMIAETAARFDDAAFLSPSVICNAAHADIVAREVTGDGAILLEPVGRNTAPAAAIAALHAKAIGADLVFLSPADHHITDVAALQSAITQAAPAAREGYIVTFGITPTRPETGYGYIKTGERESDAISDGVRRVAQFVEKPDLATAQSYLDHGGYNWNAGLFLFAPDTLLAELDAHASDALAPARAAYQAARCDGRTLALDADAFARCKSVSIDYAVMEATARAACLAVDIGWSDIGSYATLKDVLPADDQGHALGGNAMGGATSIASRDCLVSSDGPRISLVGVDGLGVIVRNGEILVVRLDQGQSVKTLVDTLKASNQGNRL